MADGTERVLPPPGGIPGIEQPVFAGGDADTPAPPIDITGTPIIPPPILGDPALTPEFPPVPPDTAPVDVPLGPMVGPAVAPAGVPPSLAGVEQPQFETGDETTPESYIPEQTTTFPVPTVVINNTQPPPDPPEMIATTQNIFLGGWAGPPPGPPDGTGLVGP